MYSNTITRRAVGSPTAEYLVTLSLLQAREQVTGDNRVCPLIVHTLSHAVNSNAQGVNSQSPASCTARWTAGPQPYSGSARIRVMFCPDPGCHGMPRQGLCQGASQPDATLALAGYCCMPACGFGILFYKNNKISNFCTSKKIRCQPAAISESSRTKGAWTGSQGADRTQALKSWSPGRTE